MANQELSREEQLIAFFVRLGDGQIGRTQLMKFLYLADYEARRYLGRPLSGLEYVWYHYGPFDDRVQRIVAEMERRELLREHQIVFPTGQVGYRYEASDKNVAFDFSSSELQIMKFVFDSYASMPLRELLDDVVYETEPMQQARQMDAKNEPLKMDIVNNARREQYGITFEELFGRVQRARAGAVRSHAQVMTDLRARIYAAA